MRLVIIKNQLSDENPFSIFILNLEKPFGFNWLKKIADFL